MTIGVKWAEYLGWRSADSFYEALAIAILVEDRGVLATATLISQSVERVKQLLEVYEVASMPRIKTTPQDRKRYLERILRGHPDLTIEKLAERINQPVERVLQWLSV